MSGNGEIGRGIIGVALVFILAHLLTGCSTAKLGDNKVGPIPVPVVAAAADVAQPGAGKIITRAEGAISAYVDAKNATNAPFGGRPYTEEVVVLLREPVTGLTVKRDQIDTIRRTRTEIPSDPIVEEITLDQLADDGPSTAVREMLKNEAFGWADILKRVEDIRGFLVATNHTVINPDDTNALYRIDPAALEAIGVTQ